MQSVYRVILGVATIVTLLHVWGALEPSHYNWGVHLFAFHPPEVSMLALLVALAVILPTSGRWITKFVGRYVESLGNIPGWAVFLFLGGISVALMLAFPAAMHLLGDSALILELTPDDPTVADSSQNFRNQPLTYYALRGVQYLLGGGDPVPARSVYSAIGLGAGLARIALIIWFVRTRKIGALEKVLIAAFLLIRASAQFFFGYVENYVLLNVFRAAFIMTGWFALERRIHPIVPVVCFFIMAGMHLASMVFLPVLFFLLFPLWKERRSLVTGLSVLSVGGAILLVWGLGYGPTQFIKRVSDAFTYDFLPLLSPPGGLPYGIFSWLHMVDWLNAVLLIAPFSMAAALVLLAMSWKKQLFNDPILLFLGSASAIGVIMSLVINPALGMARDWDFIASFLAPSSFLFVYLFINHFRSGDARMVFMALVVINALHVGAWIGINADEDRHLARAQLLTVPVLSGTFPKIYYENLGNAFYKKKMYERSRHWYGEYLAIDSMNPRIVANYAFVCKKLGDSENYFKSLRLSAALKSHDPRVYSNLAVEYAGRGDTGKALEFLNQSLRVDSNFGIAHANLALLHLNASNVPLVLHHAQKAIENGFNEPSLLKIAGQASYRLGKYRESLSYYQRCLQLKPADTSVMALIDRLKELVGSPVVRPRRAASSARKKEPS